MRFHGGLQTGIAGCLVGLRGAGEKYEITQTQGHPDSAGKSDDLEKKVM